MGECHDKAYTIEHDLLTITWNQKSCIFLEILKQLLQNFLKMFTVQSGVLSRVRGLMELYIQCHQINISTKNYCGL